MLRGCNTQGTALSRLPAASSSMGHGRDEKEKPGYGVSCAGLVRDPRDGAPPPGYGIRLYNGSLARAFLIQLFFPLQYNACLSAMHV